MKDNNIENMVSIFRGKKIAMHLKFYFQFYKSYSFHNIIDTRNKITRVKNIIVSNIYTGDIKLIHRLNSKRASFFTNKLTNF